MFVLKKYLHVLFFRQRQRRTVCSPLSPCFCTVHQNSDMDARKKIVREEINKYSGEIGGHSVTFALKGSFMGHLIFQYIKGMNFKFSATHHNFLRGLG